MLSVISRSGFSQPDSAPASVARSSVQTGQGETGSGPVDGGGALLQFRAPGQSGNGDRGGRPYEQ